MPSPISHRNTGNYFVVELGPLDGTPPWHPLGAPSRHQFPDELAANRFADNHRDGVRSVVVRHPDGRGWDGERWVD